MDNNKEEIVRIVTTGGMISIVAAAIRALLVKNESPMQKLRTFGAGVLMGILMTWILRNSTFTQMTKDLVTSGSAAFVSTVWPILEKQFAKWTTKKLSNGLPDNNDN